MAGSRFSRAISWARRCFLTVIGKYVPPFTVASFATTITSRPETLPTPVTSPAPGAPPSYRPCAARGATSRNELPGSRRRSRRSLTGSFPSSRWRATALAPPPSRVRLISSRSRAARDEWWPAFSRNSTDAGSIRVRSRSVTASGSGRRDEGADHVHRARRRGSREENLSDSRLLQRCDVLLRDDPTEDDGDSVSPALFQRREHLGEQPVVGSRENR